MLSGTTAKFLLSSGGAKVRVREKLPLNWPSDELIIREGNHASGK
jgi:hypothetical protein